MTPQDAATPDDARGMVALLRMLGGNPALEAARAVLAHPGRIVVATGFPVRAAAGGFAPETDGPPGAVALLRAARALSRDAALVSWPAAIGVMAPELPGVALLPMERLGAGDACVAVECCGTTAAGARRSMRGEDLRDAAPCFEDAIGDEVLVAVGDGGNEVGMGSAPPSWLAERGVERPRSTARALVPASVSNWGALAVVAEMSSLAGVDLLPSVAAHEALVRRLVARGCVDGFTGRREARIDGRELAAELDVLATLRRSRGNSIS